MNFVTETFDFDISRTPFVLLAAQYIKDKTNMFFTAKPRTENVDCCILISTDKVGADTSPTRIGKSSYNLTILVRAHVCRCLRHIMYVETNAFRDEYVTSRLYSGKTAVRRFRSERTPRHENRIYENHCGGR